MSTIYAQNIYYFECLNSIGGTESFLYYLVKKYSDKNLLVVYKEGDSKQIERLNKYAKTIKYNNQHFICDKVFFNYRINIIDNVTANDYYVIIHGDYNDRIKRGQLKKKNMPIHKKITKYIGVSELACKSFQEVTGQKCELCYNPISLDKPKKMLNLISATRLTAEKGKNRMIKFAEILEQNNIPYTWTIFTNDTNAINNPNIVYRKPTLDILDHINNADYLVQLSDNEGYCYSIIEALMCGTPVICTECPVFFELGLKNKHNCYFCDFEMENIPVLDIYNNIPSFTYAPPKDNWEELLKTNNIIDYKDKVYVIAKRKFYDTENNIIRCKDEKWQVSKDRSQKLLNSDIVKLDI